MHTFIHTYIHTYIHAYMHRQVHAEVKRRAPTWAVREQRIRKLRLSLSLSPPSPPAERYDTTAQQQDSEGKEAGGGEGEGGGGRGVGGGQDQLQTGGWSAEGRVGGGGGKGGVWGKGVWGLPRSTKESSSGLTPPSAQQALTNLYYLDAPNNKANDIRAVRGPPPELQRPVARDALVDAVERYRLRLNHVLKLEEASQEEEVRSKLREWSRQDLEREGYPI
jgi:hypothetical protein